MNKEGLTTALIDVAGRSIRTLGRAGEDFSASSALAALEAHGPVTVSDFARHYGCTQPAASQWLAKLEGRGLAVRSRSPRDGRVRRFALTDAGADRLAATRSSAADLLGPALDELSDADRRALCRVITALDTVLTAHAQEQR